MLEDQARETTPVSCVCCSLQLELQVSLRQSVTIRLIYYLSDEASSFFHGKVEKRGMVVIICENCFIEFIHCKEF